MNLRQITIKDQLELKKVYFDSIQSLDEKIYNQEQKRAWSSQAWNNPNFDKSIIKGKGWLISKQGIITAFATRYPTDRIALFYCKGKFQRKGLGIAWPEPLYVKSLNRIKNIVYVADKSDLFNKEAIITKVIWVSIEEPKQEIQVEAQIRYRSHPVKGTLIPMQNSNISTKSFKLIFEESQSSVTPGQAAVFYKGEILLGGGLIN